jgi:hypothetical protein
MGIGGFTGSKIMLPVHGPAGEVIREHFEMLDWQSHSPDRSPIEMLWFLIKRRLKGQQFENENALFTAIETAWNEVPMSVINNLVGSFKARLQVGLELGENV